MSDEYDHEFPPSEWRVDGIATALQEAPETYPLPTYDDAAFWQSVRSDDSVSGIVAAAREKAAEVSEGPVPPLPASGYLRYTREGVREGYPDGRRRRELGALVLAECLERDGEYVDSALDYLWAICEQATWTQPPHLPEDGPENVEGLPVPVPSEDHHIALRSAGTAKLLAEVTHVFGDRLHPAARDRVAHEIDERILTPYLRNDEFGWFHPPANNWNAVCNGSVLIAALHAEDDPERQARIVARAVGSMRHYLNGFDGDGCTAEGVGYWKYGFGFYTKAAAHLEARTAGEYSLFAPPVVREIARFPLRIELSRNRFPSFSDASETNDLTPYVTCKLGQRLDLPELVARGREDLETQRSVGYFSSAIRNLAWGRIDVDTEPPSPPLRSFFRGRDWWVVRAAPDSSGGLVVAAKGGHNGEPHNHNDCGSFICHYRGESLLADPGPGEYDSEYFGPNRYENFAPRSLGHSVPHVNGYEQASGSEYAAEPLERVADDARERYVLDLAGCYPDAAGLESLRRAFVLDRTAETEADGRLLVSDEARFAEDAPGRELASLLVSYFPIEAEADRLLVRGDEATATVRFDGAVDVEVERVEDAVQGTDVWRARCSPSVTGWTTTVETTIAPARSDS